MARRDWHKLHRQSQAQQAQYDDWGQQRYRRIDQAYRGKNIWQIGKHKGTPITQLPTHYLIWVSENLKGIHKGTADKEIVKRYQAKATQTTIQHTRLAGQK